MAATLQLVLRKDQLTKNGEAKVYLRIIKNRKVTNMTTGIKVPESQWDMKKGRVKNTHPNSARMNAHLTKLLARYTDEMLEAEQQDLSVTTKAIREKIAGRSDADLFVIGNQIADRARRGEQIGSLAKINTILAKIKTYTGRETLLLMDVTTNWLHCYEGYLIETLKNKPNTVHKDMRFIRQIFNEGVRNDLIAQEHNPFRKIRLKSVKTEKVFLTMDEIEALAELNLPAGTKLRVFRDMFVFACYAGGLRISDVLLLRWSNVHEGRVTLRIKKTKTPTAFLIPLQAQAILCRYQREDAEPSHFVFPVLPVPLNMKDAVAVDKAISGATAHVNKVLKDLAGRAKIEKHISFHTSRHSFAVNALRKGIRLEYVSRIMGHASVQETQVYAKIVNADLDVAMEAFNE